jgi:hypothetical protein
MKNRPTKFRQSNMARDSFGIAVQSAQDIILRDLYANKLKFKFVHQRDDQSDMNAPHSCLYSFTSSAANGEQRRPIMKFMHACRIKILEGVRSHEERGHQEKDMISLRQRQRSSQRRSFCGIPSIHELGWQRAYTLRCR